MTGPTGPTGERHTQDHPAARPPGLSPLSWLRWAWRQLTSMRTALILLFLLALAAVPGSLVPQRSANPDQVTAFTAAHPSAALWYDRLSLFTVYSSPWFAAVYLLLFTSLIGCIVPRVKVHARAMRSRPTLTPRVLSRLPAHAEWTTPVPAAEVLATAQARLGRRRRHRLADRPGPLDPVAAERGVLRETGNLVFHLALLVVLAGVAAGSLFGYRGTTIVTEGETFANQPLTYSDLATGALRDRDRLPPFTMTLDSFDARFFTSGPKAGTPQLFRGQVTVVPEPGGPSRADVLRLNHPVSAGGADVSLLGNGYAPRFTVRDASGQVVSQGSTVFLPEDQQYTSTGVVKVPDARPTGLEFLGNFLPTALQGVPTSVFAGPGNPQVRMTVYRGDVPLGAVASSVYRPDQAAIDAGLLRQYRTATGQPLTFTLRPGDTFTLPDGAASISFDGFRRWAYVQVVDNPGDRLVLGGSIAAVTGLCGSLFVRRRRWWVRATTEPGSGHTFVEVAGLDRSDNSDLDEELRRLVTDLHRAAPPLPTPPPGADPTAPPQPNPRQELAS